MVCAAIVSYLGPISYSYRENVIKKAIMVCIEKKLAISNHFTFENIISDAG